MRKPWLTPMQIHGVSGAFRSRATRRVFTKCVFSHIPLIIVCIVCPAFALRTLEHLQRTITMPVGQPRHAMIEANARRSTTRHVAAAITSSWLYCASIVAGRTSLSRLHSVGDVHSLTIVSKPVQKCHYRFSCRRHLQWRSWWRRIYGTQKQAKRARNRAFRQSLAVLCSHSKTFFIGHVFCIHWKVIKS